MNNTTIHYNSSMKLTELKLQGQGECGTNGYISGYMGMITCKTCQKIAKQEAAEAFTAAQRLIK